jgi:DNA-binding NarL/FixJ family response regulator
MIRRVCVASATFCSILDKQAQVEALASPLAVAQDGQACTSSTPKRFDGLGQKQTDLSQYFDLADLTDRQRECASLKWEFGLPDRQIAERLDIHHKTVQESLNASNKRLQRNNEKFRLALKRRAANSGSRDETD